MSKMIEEFRKYLEIDRGSLDKELAQQPGLFYEVSEEYVHVAANRDALKDELAVVDAELDSEVRRDLEIGGEKFTEAMVKSGILIHKQHKAAMEKYLTAVEDANLLSALKEAFHQRSYMIRDLASLYVANYFESSSIRGTDRTDTARYAMQREKLAEGRKK